MDKPHFVLLERQDSNLRHVELTTFYQLNYTPIEQIIPYLNYANIALVMSVKPGFGGQSFIENSLEKILFLKEYREKSNLKYEIEVDGGINAYTSKLCRESGSDILVAGSYIFSSTDYKQKIKELNNENL